MGLYEGLYRVPIRRLVKGDARILDYSSFESDTVFFLGHFIEACLKIIVSFNGNLCPGSCAQVHGIFETEETFAILPVLQ